MPICRLSASSARASLALAGFMILSASALAQDTPRPDNARDRAAAEGDAALERLERATAARKKEAETRGPTALPTPSEETRRRAFDGLRKRAPSPAMDAHARTALDKGKESIACLLYTSRCV